MADEERSRSLVSGPADTASPARDVGRDTCACLDWPEWSESQLPVRFHAERQDTSAPGWLHLLDLIDEAAADGRREFAPMRELSPGERRQIITLPSTIAKLTRIQSLYLYGSNLVRLPPEIGALINLEEFTPYVSRRMHWFPFELTRCMKLRRSTVSTRALYGNYKSRLPFPQLHSLDAISDNPDDLDPGIWGAETVRTCSVCAQPVAGRGLHQRWISLRIATDTLPLLVNACSPACVQALPPAAEGYVPGPHMGGPGLEQPERR
jgi:hypothetical protein